MARVDIGYEDASFKFQADFMFGTSCKDIFILHFGSLEYMQQYFC